MLLASRVKSAGGLRIPVEGLLAEYKMDNIVGSVLVDTVGGYDGNIVGASQAPGLVGDALWFDGSNDRVVVPLPIAGGVTYSLSAWVHKTNVSTTNAAPLISGGFGGDPDGLTIYTENYLNAAPAIVSGVSTSFQSLYIDGDPAAEESGFPLNEWHHVLFVGTCLHIDGADHWIGANNNATNFYAGGLDLVRLYQGDVGPDGARALSRRV